VTPSRKLSDIVIGKNIVMAYISRNWSQEMLYSSVRGSFRTYIC